MFILFFLVFTLIFTVFENVLIAGISLLFIFLGLYIYQSIRKKKILSRVMIVSIVGGFLLAGMAFGVKERRYYDMSFSYSKSSILKDTSSFTKEDKNGLLVGTGIVDDISNQGKYVFIYKDDKYLLYSKKEYSIGDQLWIVGNITPPTPSKIEGESYRRITSGTFAIPLFSGSFDFPTWMKMKGWKGTIYETNSIILRDPGTPRAGEEQGIRDEEVDEIVIQQTGFRPQNLTPEGGPAYLAPEGGDKVNTQSIGIIKSMKKGIQEKIIQIYGKGRIAGLILGMLIGDRSQIPESEYQYFINSGLVHLVAVSGGNILMIVVFLQCILFFIPFYIRLGFILLTIIGYSLICGLDSSVFRAVLMGGMSMIALFRGREINIWRLLSMSCIVMLVINPYFLAYDVGFLLSYSAIIGLIYIGTKEIKDEKVQREEKKISTDKDFSPENSGSKGTIKKALLYTYKSYISPSIGASIGIFPIIIFFMGKINIFGIIGNLFVLPIVPFVMIYGFISIRIYSLFGWEWLLWIEKILVQYIYKISELLSQYGLYFSVTGLRFKYVVLLVCGVLFILRRNAQTDR